MTEQKFLKEIIKWKKEFGIEEMYVERDDNIEYAAFISKGPNKKPILTYQWKSIVDYGKDYKWILFHEFGHIVNGTYLLKKCGKKDRLISEYLAEKFAYEMVERYFPKESKRMLNEKMKRLTDAAWVSHWPLHAIAFNKVYLEKIAYKDNLRRLNR